MPSELQRSDVEPNGPSARNLLLLIAAALGIAAISAVAMPGLGYDAWTWMIWAREIGHLSLNTTTGSTIKPLPMLVMAPFASFGDLAPFVWLTLARAAFLLMPFAGWRLGSLLGGRYCALLSAVSTLMIPLAADSAVNGYTEPLIILLTLTAAAELILKRTQRAMLVMVLIGLIRPEVWPFVLVIAIWAVRGKKLSAWRAVLITLAAPAIWMTLGWVGSGRPLGGSELGQIVLGGDDVLRQALTGVVPIIGIGVILAAVLAVRQRNRVVLLLGGTALAWVLLVTVMTLLSLSSGNSRYLAPAEALAGVLGAWGLTESIGLLTSVTAKRLAAGIVVVGLAFSAMFGLVSLSRSVDRFTTYSKAADQMKGAIALAGGRDQVLAVGKPVVMNWSRVSALAWQLDVPITGVRTIWRVDWFTSTKLPTILIAAPVAKAGPRSAIPRQFRTTLIGKYGPWQVMRAERAVANNR